ncbi:YebC/PmpR family DNA-binding transcriptional regulator [Ureaplasma ceti]|uniref:Probable transcriptional regulatory protein UREOM_4630 n=1 Tax=Ureaplasma ceti TaxID=3119530 RepID=A0ABP9U9J6_9BACT
MPRKHLIASGINKKQQQQSKIWMKCAREIKAAVKVGGPNPEANPRLKAAIVRALQNNLSRDSIQRNISGADKDAASLKEVTYEGRGPKGLAIIVKALTDNEQRTISAVRGYFSKLHGEISKPNSAMILFDEHGQIIIEKTADLTEDKILETVLDFDVVDLRQDETAFELLVTPETFFDAKQALEDAGIAIAEADVKLIPNSTVDITEEENEKLERFIEQCEDDDDVQWVVTNLGDILD